ncbi:SRPBCC domain-containing protein [Peribacillus frigoritolerans]|uniref:SRPBCC domain-containing protein n=1 Tax=Peribacillus frigoritolerans TaxID=450367 RepID=UPI0024BF4875|nr:SRPBCC domain-containing protein [Peribacillus frigoritolerans]MEB2493795.1 SRPBCC domain-containing protein [Peribacillus frigoritolerans]WHY13493.1 SRPBCC domain-containing protein [Peribacillus frigoritolerans]
MTEQLIVRDEILIEANSQKVWEVLTKPKYVAEWDELPENYPNEDMTEGSKVIWELPNGGQSITKIIRAVVKKELKIALHVSNWEVKPNEGDVAYNYQLKEKGDSTLLRIEIGDFSLIKDGKMYYDASVEFASDSKQIIKKLSENLG